MTATTAGVLRVLGPRDLPEVRRLLARDPVAHCFVASRVLASNLDSWRMGGELWGWVEDGELVSLLYLGANLVPVEVTPDAERAFADRCRRIGRRCSSIVGPADEVAGLWAKLAHAWGPAREIRGGQPVMVIDPGDPLLVEPDPLVRRVRDDEVDILMPACVAMFTEEVGVSPLAGGGAEPYRARVAELVRSGRAFARIEDGEVLVKAEVGAVGEGVCQVQGVWTAPHLRGQGLGLAGMSRIVELSRDIAPVVSLYVNDYNHVARHVYERVGFRQAGRFATVLF